MTPEERAAARRRADEITSEVAARHGLEPRCLRYDMPHSKRYARPRGEAAREIKEALGWSDSQIGKYFGGFHPSTILSCRRPKFEPAGRKPMTRENIVRQLWDLRRRVEWLEQRAGLPPMKVGDKRGTERAGLPPIESREER